MPKKNHEEEIWFGAAPAKITEGAYTFVIKDIEYDKDFGTIKLMLDVPGVGSLRYNIYLRDNNGAQNERHMALFGRICRAAMRDESLEQCRPMDIEGKRFNATLKYNTSDTNGKTYTNLYDIAEALDDEEDLRDIDAMLAAED